MLGHSEREFERLRRQARFVEPITRRFLLEAGIAANMRILDVGSGGGDVSILARDLVGAGGEVIGVDRSPHAVAAATARTTALAFANVTFRTGNPADMTFDRQFDAVIGRYVREFQADPAGMLREAFVGGAPGCAEYLRIGVVDLMENVASDMDRLGIATTEELDLATLEERMLAEIATNGSVIIGRSEIAAWTRV
ncbi:MAG TPA: methyltransferase domain-containing protein [Candidatus Binatia bacterium]